MLRFRICFFALALFALTIPACNNNPSVDSAKTSDSGDAPAQTAYVAPKINVTAPWDEDDELDLAEHVDSIDLVLELLADEDRDMRAIGFDQIRSEVPGTDPTKRFAREFPNLSQDAQVGLLSALADRGDLAAKPAFIALLADSKTNEQLQVAAIRSLGKMGDASDTPQLIHMLSIKNVEAASMARQSLIDLQGEGVPGEIVKGIQAVPVPLKLKLIDILTARRAFDTVPDLLKMATGDNADTRMAAMKSLGKLAGPEQMPGLVKGVLTAIVGKEREAAEKNLMFVCNRIEDKENRAEPLLTAMKDLSTSDRTIMIPALGRIGGKASLAEVDKAIASRDAATHFAGIRAISNWPDASVADRLIKLAKSDKHADHQRIARMSLLRVAPLRDGRTEAEMLELLKTGMEMATNDKERNFGIKRASAIRIVETLRYVLTFIDQPEFTDQTCQTVVELSHDRKLRDDNKPEFHAALDKVLAITKDEVLIDRATRYKKGETWLAPGK